MNHSQTEFTPEDLKVLKVQVEYSLNRALYVARRNPKGLPRPVVVKHEIKDFKVRPDENQYEVLEELVAFNKKVKGTISHLISEGPGRIGYYEYTKYTVKYPTLIEEVTETLVKKCVHKALVKLMGLSEYSTINCKLMQLFKDGKLSWEDTINSHKIHCAF